MRLTPFSFGHRWLAVDALRGVACVWMAVYHFCFDLRVFGWQPDWNFYSDPFWTSQRTAILSTFLLCAGIGQGIASAQGQNWQRFWRRWLQVAGGAALVSLSTYWAFEQRFVSFGVLHGIAIMLIITRLLAQNLRPRYFVALGLGIIALHFFYQAQVRTGSSLPAAFDSRWLNWLGLVSHKPATEDFVPLLPWLGVMLLGAALGLLLQAQSKKQASLTSAAGPSTAVQGLSANGLAHDYAVPPNGVLDIVLRPLIFLGQHSLPFYLLHQPIFWGLLYGAAWLGFQA